MEFILVKDSKISMYLSLYGIELPKQNNKTLTDSVKNLQSGSKKNLYFLYSEYFNRAWRNKSYASIFNKKDNIIAIDGKGVEWANFVLRSKRNLKLMKSKLNINTNSKSGKFFLWVQIVINCISNFFNGFWYNFSKKNSFGVTHNKVILGRNFKDSVFEIAKVKMWNVLLIGAFTQEALQKIKRVYPNLNLSIWSMDFNSSFMRDESFLDKEVELKLGGFAKLNFKHKLLNSDNLMFQFPQFESLCDLIRKNNFDLLVFTCGGATGKQEFIMDYLQQKEDIKYTLAVGLGAAFDHLGAGKAQEKTPDFINGIGLEWLFRIFTNPSRVFRIIDSILVFYYLVSIYPFVNKNYFNTEVEQR